MVTCQAKLQGHDEDDENEDDEDGESKSVSQSDENDEDGDDGEDVGRTLSRGEVQYSIHRSFLAAIKGASKEVFIPHPQGISLLGTLA